MQEKSDVTIEEIIKLQKQNYSQSDSKLIKKAYDYATSKMYKYDNNHKKEYIEPYTKEQVDELLRVNDIALDNKIMYDYVFAATMCKADYLGSSIVNEEYLAKYVKDVVDDPDASDETTFRRWVATMIGNGEPIDWSEIC